MTGKPRQDAVGRVRQPPITQFFVRPKTKGGIAAPAVPNIKDVTTTFYEDTKPYAKVAAKEATTGEWKWIDAASLTDAEQIDLVVTVPDDQGNDFVLRMSLVAPKVGKLQQKFLDLDVTVGPYDPGTKSCEITIEESFHGEGNQ